MKINALLTFVFMAIFGIENLNALYLEGVDKEKIILEQIQKNIIAQEKVDFIWQIFSDKKIKNKTKLDENNKKNGVKKKPLEKKVVKSKGQLKVEELLAKQRAKIKKKQDLDKKKYSSKKVDSNWMKRRVENSENWIKEKNKEQENWQRDKLAALKQWALAKEKFNKELPKLKKDLTDLDEYVKDEEVQKEAPVEETKVDAQIGLKEISKVKSSATIGALKCDLIKEDFSIDIGNQGMRSTCAAFAGVRAMEILLRRKGRQWDLSEQFFYFASKPKCQSSPCTKKGSWPIAALNKSIPLEQKCPYEAIEKNGNETQIPLASSCSLGRARVEKYRMIKGRREIQDSIRKGIAVIGGFKLNEAFYKNKGFVFVENKSTLKSTLDRHASGHALLLMGVLELPQKLWRTQGKHCTLVANSWGEGWGIGGYACLSDRWFEKYRYSFSFLALEDVTLK